PPPISCPSRFCRSNRNKKALISFADSAKETKASSQGETIVCGTSDFARCRFSGPDLTRQSLVAGFSALYRFSSEHDPPAANRAFSNIRRISRISWRHQIPGERPVRRGFRTCRLHWLQKDRRFSCSLP